MAEYVDNNVTLEGVRIVYRNFEGKQDKYNEEGNRNFAIVLDDEQYEKFLADGWNVKRKPSKEEGEGYFNTFPVKVNFKGRRPPRLVLITSKGRTSLDEDLAMIIDYADIEFCDVMIRPYDWTVNGNKGRKAYLVAIYVKIHEDALERKYAEVPEIDAPSRKELMPGQDPNTVDADYYEEEE